MATAQVAETSKPNGRVVPIKDIVKDFKTVHLKVRFGMLGNSRKISDSQVTEIAAGEEAPENGERNLVEVNADKKLIKIQKTLLDSKELTAIRNLDADLRDWLKATALPYDKAIYMVPFSLVETVDEKIEEFQKERKKLINDFLKAYPKLCADAEVRLRGVYNAADYPSVEYVRSRFTFWYKFERFGVPGELQDIAPEIFRRERKKAQESLKRTEEAITQVMRETAAQLVKHLAESLGENGVNPKTGEPRQKKLYDTTVDKLKYFLQNFDLRNITNDTELKRYTKQAEDLLAGVSTESLRTTDGVRQKVREGMESIAKQLETLVENAPTRKFRFDED